MISDTSLKRWADGLYPFSTPTEARRTIKRLAQELIDARAFPWRPIAEADKSKTYDLWDSEMRLRWIACTFAHWRRHPCWIDMHGNKATGVTHFLEITPPTTELCEDEGCPHHGTPHVCTPPTAGAAPWKRCPSNHCEYRQECCSPNGCLARPDAGGEVTDDEDALELAFEAAEEEMRARSQMGIAIRACDVWDDIQAALRAAETKEPTR